MQTKLIRSIYNLKDEASGGVVTIGNFDGVHIGHQQLIAQVISRAKILNVPSIVITFEPQPFEFFSGDKLAIPRITRFREKFTLLQACGIDYVLLLPFNQQLAKKTASSFIKDILVDGLKIKEIIVGDDFHFGYKREGNFALLKELSSQFGFKAASIPTTLIGGERVSSTRVRQALASADQVLIEQLLGRPYTMQGRVRYGDQLGRLLGFPTINIHLHRKLTPINGVYTVLVKGLEEGMLWPGAANIGVRPTVDGTRCLLEVHLLNFNKEIYGHYLTVQFCEKLHDEVHYPNLEILKNHIAEDVEMARNYFRKKGML